MSKIEDKAIEVMDKTLNGIDKLTVMLSDVADKYGQDVIDAALIVVQITGFKSVLMFSVFLISSTIFFVCYRKILIWAKKHGKASSEVSYCVPIFGLFIFLTLFIISTIKLLDPWPWVAMFEPKLWIAHEILKW